jgi:flagellar biosynthesis component FlhA
MEWTEILNWVFGGTSLVGLATTLIFWSKSKRKEEAETQKSESEAEQADIETQKQKIDLGNKYIEDTFKTVEMMKDLLNRSDGNQEKMMRKLDTLAEQNKKQDGLLTDIVTYLNGDFQEFLQRTHKKGEQDNEQHT